MFRTYNEKVMFFGFSVFHRRVVHSLCSVVDVCVCVWIAFFMCTSQFVILHLMMYLSSLLGKSSDCGLAVPLSHFGARAGSCCLSGLAKLDFIVPHEFTRIIFAIS